MDRLASRIGLSRIFGVATLLGIFSALLAYAYITVTGREQPLYVLLPLNITYWYSWALLVPGILWMAQRYRFGRHSWKRAAGMHLLGVIAFTFVHAVLTITLREQILTQLSGRDILWLEEFQELFFLNFDWEQVTYWAVVGLSHALDFHRESQERELAAAQLETELAEAQLQALQRQLHPHFLFNTLHTISALMHRDTQAADDMLARLSDLLRLTLDRIGTQQVTLKDEIDFLQKYLEIERTRFGERLQVHLDIEPGTLDAAVPNLVLQPLVENALRHGIAPKVGGGRVDISASRHGAMLRLVVRDNGAGLSSDKLKDVNTGVGLSNTRSRLEHLYPGAHRFDFDAPPSGGLIVTVEFPFSVEQESPDSPRMESVA